MKVLITGGNGYIGRAFCNLLKEKGQEYFVYDKANGHDLADSELIATVMHAYRPDWVLHLAATPGVAADIDVGLRDITNTANLLKAMKSSDCKHIAFASTGSVYGEQCDFPTPIDAPMRLQTGYYANSKLACEGLISTFCGREGVDGVIMRLGTVLGPGNRKGFVADWVRKLTDNPDELSIWGDGYQVKSYIHVNDCVEAMFMSMREKYGCHVLNIAHDHTASIRECLPWVLDELGVNPVVTFGLSASGGFGDIPKIVLSNRELQDLGWSPKKSIEDAVRENVRTMIVHKFRDDLAAAREDADMLRDEEAKRNAECNQLSKALALVAG